MAKVQPIPDGYRRVTPYLYIGGAAAAIEFYKEVFGAKERMRMGDDSMIGHAELELGDSVIMLSDENPEMGVRGPKSIGGTAVSLNVYVEDVDDTFARAIKLGATEVRAVEDQFYGDRSGVFNDPFGHQWSVSTHVEDVAPDEMERRMAEMMGGAG